ncbi:Mediator complex subunit Med21 [Penicillium hispanicum]|uniref:Mediator complex subunit Med21 n=1 Tax=Penicillium hispanicum TaxID=1080232 RepID=UPI00254269E9|nr:Mediator complex subunit Med21 [Penicillium hispanicum]KAJ5584409.1 Mediator complex subunit Med21 [Penicillium hispanicum]
MADILTQLQTCLDQLATQFYATLGYLTTYHDNSPATPPPNVPDAAPALAKISKNTTSPPVPASIAEKTGAGGSDAIQAQASPPPPNPQQPGATAEDAQVLDPNLPPRPDSPRTFASRQRELARDLIIKEQQIEYLISVLPGIGASEAEQEARIRELETQLRDVEKERTAKAKELKKLRGRLENVLGAVSVGIHGDGKYQK